MKSHQFYLPFGLVAIVLFQQCTPIRLYQDEVRYFTEIPLKHQKQEDTKIYFPDDLKPERPYIEAGVVRFSGSGLQRTQLMAEKFKTQAQELGMDAVLITPGARTGFMAADFGTAPGDTETMMDVNSGQAEGEFIAADGFDSYGIPVLQGIGIKYLDNIHDIEQAVKSEKVYFADKPDEILYIKAYFLNGETKSIDYDKQLAIDIHNNVVEAYDLHHLIHQQANWGYRSYDGRVTTRALYKTPDWKLKICRLIYDFEDRKSIKRIVVRYPGQEKKDVIKLYRKFGEVEMKEIYQLGLMVYKEKLAYDDMNRLVTRKIYKVKDEEEHLWLVAEYNYYQNSELKNYLDKAVNKKS